jgi:hypothetical protein
MLGLRCRLHKMAKATYCAAEFATVQTVVPEVTP